MVWLSKKQFGTGLPLQNNNSWVLYALNTLQYVEVWIWCMFNRPQSSILCPLQRYILTQSTILFYKALRNKKGKYFLNGDWKIVKSTDIKLAGTVFVYHHPTNVSEEAETLKSKGPTHERIMVTVRTCPSLLTFMEIYKSPCFHFMHYFHNLLTFDRAAWFAIHKCFDMIYETIPHRLEWPFSRHHKSVFVKQNLALPSEYA